MTGFGSCFYYTSPVDYLAYSCLGFSLYKLRILVIFIESFNVKSVFASYFIHSFTFETDLMYPRLVSNILCSQG